MNESIEERLKRITDYVKSAHDIDATPLLNFGDLNWLIARAGLAAAFGAYIDGHAMGMESITIYTNQIKDENKRLREELEESNHIKDVMDGHLVRTGRKIIDREKAWAESQYQLHEVLEFYADSKNYEVNVIDQWEPKVQIMTDGGDKARQALEQTKPTMAQRLVRHLDANAKDHYAPLLEQSE